MRQAPRAFPPLAALYLALAGLAPIAAGQEVVPPDGLPQPVAVATSDGRLHRGLPDARTDSTDLWLRSERGRATLRRPIPWTEVERVRVLDVDLSAEQFREIVESVRQENPFQPETDEKPPVLVLRGEPSANRDPAQRGQVHVFGQHSTSTATPLGRKMDRTPATQPSPPAKVRSLAVEAVVANWDADVEVDGLLLTVYPIDDYGRVVPVRGMLEVDLRAERLGVVVRPQPFIRMARWTRRIRPDDFLQGDELRADGAVYRLPFQAIHPEFDQPSLSQGGFSPQGLVHVRLSVPGHGTFEASADMVRIRPYSSVRDHLQQATGHRFFPHEHTGDGRR